MMTMARTFLSLIYYNSWLRHGRKLELTPCSVCNVHKLYLLLQRIKARSSITSTFCFLCQRVFNKGYSSRPTGAKLLCSICPFALMLSARVTHKP